MLQRGSDARFSVTIRIRINKRMKRTHLLGCHRGPPKNEIHLAASHVAHDPADEVRDTILHEIARYSQLLNTTSRKRGLLQGGITTICSMIGAARSAHSRGVAQTSVEN